MDPRENDRTTTTAQSEAVPLSDDGLTIANRGVVMVSGRSAPGPSFVYLGDLPDDLELLAAVGRVAIRHAQLEDQVKMTVKTLSGMTPEATRAKFKRTAAINVREEVLSLGRERFGEGETLRLLTEAMDKCETLSWERNDEMHRLWATELDGGHVSVDPSGATKPLPTVGELNALADRIHQHRKRLTHDRQEGYLCLALRRG